MFTGASAPGKVVVREWRLRGCWCYTEQSAARRSFGGKEAEGGRCCRHAAAAVALLTFLAAGARLSSSRVGYTRSIWSLPGVHVYPEAELEHVKHRRHARWSQSITLLYGSRAEGVRQGAMVVVCSTPGSAPLGQSRTAVWAQVLVPRCFIN